METEQHLTQAHTQRIDELRSQTAIGMAHWAGTGPDGKNCQGCRHARFHGYYAARGKGKGQLKPMHCAKYAEIMGHTPKFEGKEAACRFFIEGDGPPKKP